MRALTFLLKFAVRRIVGKISVDWKVYKIPHGYRLRRWYLIVLRYMPMLPFFFFVLVTSSGRG